MHHFHIVGCPRSGTTLAFEMFKSCFSHDWHCEFEQSILKPIPLGVSTCFTKNPDDIMFIDKILAKHPSLHVLYMLRDPRSVVTSQHREHPGYFCNFKTWRTSFQKAQKLQDHPRVALMRYEDLVTDPNQFQEKLKFYFPFLTQINRFSQFKESAKPNQASDNALNGLREVDMNRISGWKQHLPRLKQQFEQYPSFSSALIQAGYEKNQQWQQCLEGIESRPFESHYRKDSLEPLRECERSIRRWIKATLYQAPRGSK